MDEIVKLKLDRAYTTLILRQPFIATVLLRLRKEEDPSIPTMGTDGRVLAYNKDFVLSLTSDELVGVLAHEVFHVTGLHMLRKGSREHFSWNVACDAAINPIVEELGLKLPKGGVPGQPGKSAEEIYSMLPPEMKVPRPLAGEIWEARNADGSALTESQQGELEEEIKITIRQAVATAKAAGKLNAALKRYVDASLEPRVPWREILAQFIGSFAKEDYSWSRPNRRFIQSGIFLPSLYSPTYGEVILACDTSGSIDQNQLKEICSEVLGCLALYTEGGQVPELTIAWFDTEVYPQTISDESELNPKGGGGTAFSPIFDWMRKEQREPKAVIVVTDGHCSDFGTPVDNVPVLWILTAPNTSFKPPFGIIAATINK